MGSLGVRCQGSCVRAVWGVRCLVRGVVFGLFGSALSGEFRGVVFGQFGERVVRGVQGSCVWAVWGVRCQGSSGEFCVDQCWVCVLFIFRPGSSFGQNKLGLITIDFTKSEMEVTKSTEDVNSTFPFLILKYGMTDDSCVR